MILGTQSWEGASFIKIRLKLLPWSLIIPYNYGHDGDPTGFVLHWNQKWNFHSVASWCDKDLKNPTAGAHKLNLHPFKKWAFYYFSFRFYREKTVLAGFGENDPDRFCVRLVLENTRFEKMAKMGNFQGFMGFYGPY